MTVELHLDVERFVSTEYPRVVAAVRLITGNYDGAPEAVQDTIVRLVSTPPREAPSDYAAWITVVASSRVRDTPRRKGTHKHAGPQMGMLREGTDGAPESLDGDVRAALEALPQQQRQVAVLYFLLDQTVDSIATSLGVTAETVTTQLKRARSALGARLGGEADHD